MNVEMTAVTAFSSPTAQLDKTLNRVMKYDMPLLASQSMVSVRGVKSVLLLGYVTLKASFVAMRFSRLYTPVHKL